MMDTEQYTDDNAFYSCRRCQRKLHSLSDVEHEDCYGEEVDQARQREAQRQLHRDTARLLRKMGLPERAAVHDTLADGRW